ncbi:unnamed protein product [Brassica rapa subsp. narinosa]
MAAVWEMMGVDVDVGPTTEHTKAAFGRCEDMINFVQKDFVEMFPRWDFDNIIKKEESAAETESGVKEESAVP